ARAVVEEAAVAAGRDPSAIGMDGRISWTADTAGFVAKADGWRQAGASNLSVNTMDAGFADLGEHLAALEQAAGELGLTPARG
ncbi:MAG TPA: hypothetical protein VGI31_13050, partial [Streptosporangiaceae bacterium]